MMLSWLGLDIAKDDFSTCFGVKIVLPHSYLDESGSECLVILTLQQGRNALWFDKTYHRTLTVSAGLFSARIIYRQSLTLQKIESISAFLLFHSSFLRFYLFETEKREKYVSESVG